jgi:hypothetical protein
MVAQVVAPVVGLLTAASHCQYSESESVSLAVSLAVEALDTSQFSCITSPSNTYDEVFCDRL